MTMANAASIRTIKIASLDELQPGALTVIYGDQRISLNTAMGRPEFNSKKREIDALLMKISVEYASKQVEAMAP